MDSYHILERIGEGSFGKVYRGRRKYSGHIVALKFVTKRGKNAKELQSLRDEISILRRLNHCNIIAMLDSFETEGEFCMVTEYAQGDLFQILEDDRQLPEDEIRKIAIQLTQALHVLHSNRIIHRDMKPQNILIGSKQQIKLCDFGFARAISRESSLLTSIKGTPLYMAPELVRQQPYNYTVDLWSLGVILYELAVGRPPFYTDRIVSLIDMIVREPVRYPPTMSPDLRSFLAGLLNKDPAQRMAWPAILAHAFVRETPEQQAARILLESQVRALPRFFHTSNHHSGRNSSEDVKPSVERLRTSGEWKICDPETGRQIHEAPDRVPAAADAKVPERRQPDAAKRTDAKQTHTATDTTAQFLHEWQMVLLHTICGASVSKASSATGTSSFNAMVAAANVLENDAYLRAIAALEVVDSMCASSPLLKALASLMQLQHRALVNVYKTIEATDDNRQCNAKVIAAAHASTHRILHALAAECVRSGVAVGEFASDALFQLVRCCMLFTAIANASNNNHSNNNSNDSDSEAIAYRENCQSDIRAVTAVLQLRGDVDALDSTHSKTLKWLGAMLDRSKHLTLCLEQVLSSSVIETLCAILSHASSRASARSPGGRMRRSSRDLALYAAFALATFVQPNGDSWGPLQPFPIIAHLTATAAVSPRTTTTTNLKHLFKLRSKVHFEVISQLLKSGLSELLALLVDELSARANKRRMKAAVEAANSGDTDDDAASKSESDDDDDDSDQSSVCCILKVLYHASRSSIPLSRKLPQTHVVVRDDGHARDIVAIVLDSVANHTLRGVEQYFAIELLAVILHRSVLSSDQVWRCAQLLYALLLTTSDVVLLSALSNFFANAVESSVIDDLVQPQTSWSESEEELWRFLSRGLLPPLAADAVFRLLEHDAFAREAADVRHTKLQTLACYNTRAQGLIDAGIVLLLRVAAKAGKQPLPPPTKALSEVHDSRSVPTTTVELASFVAAFRSDRVWTIVSSLLATGGCDLLSPWGLFCLLKLMRVVRELACHDLRMEASMREHLLPHLVHLLELEHITGLYTWPDAVGGGSNAVKALVHAIVKVLGIPFMHNVSDELLVGTQEVLYDVECVQELLGVLRFVGSTTELHLETTVLELPMSFLSRLVTSSEHFGAQFVDASGLRVIKDCNMLALTNAPSLLIDTVLIVSQLARSSVDNYSAIEHVNLLRELRLLVEHPEPMVRAKALNCIGNLCRHSTLFYDHLVMPIADATSLLDSIMRGLADADSYVRRFACFAIGNAAFHSNALYSELLPSIPLLLENLHDSEEKTRSNAGGALGNLVRNSDELCAELCAFDAPLELFELAMTDASIVSRRIVLFSLGNFCVYPQCFDSIVAAEPAFVAHLEQLHDDIESDEVSKTNIRRIVAKIDALSGSTSASTSSGGGYAS